MLEIIKTVRLEVKDYGDRVQNPILKLKTKNTVKNKLNILRTNLKHYFWNKIETEATFSCSFNRHSE